MTSMISRRQLPNDGNFVKSCFASKHTDGTLEGREKGIPIRVSGENVVSSSRSHGRASDFQLVVAVVVMSPEYASPSSEEGLSWVHGKRDKLLEVPWL
jgi:hypothetical protein